MRKNQQDGKIDKLPIPAPSSNGRWEIHRAGIVCGRYLTHADLDSLLADDYQPEVSSNLPEVSNVVISESGIAHLEESLAPSC